MSHHLVIRVVTKLLIPFILMFGLYVQFHGDFGPGLYLGFYFRSGKFIGHRLCHVINAVPFKQLTNTRHRGQLKPEAPGNIKLKVFAHNPGPFLYF